MSEEALQIAERREAKGRGEKERYTHLNAEFQRMPRSDMKAFHSDQCKEIEKNNRMGKTRDSSRELEIPREHFMQPESESEVAQLCPTPSDLMDCSHGEALYSQQKQDKELTVAQIMNSLLPNSDLN